MLMLMLLLSRPLLWLMPLLQLLLLGSLLLSLLCLLLQPRAVLKASTPLSLLADCGCGCCYRHCYSSPAATATKPNATAAAAVISAASTAVMTSAAEVAEVRKNTRHKSQAVISASFLPLQCSCPLPGLDDPEQAGRVISFLSTITDEQRIIITGYIHDGWQFKYVHSRAKNGSLLAVIHRHHSHELESLSRDLSLLVGICDLLVEQHVRQIVERGREILEAALVATSHRPRDIDPDTDLDVLQALDVA
jgi:hypothetical protein